MPVTRTPEPTPGARVTRWMVESRLPPDVERNLERIARTDDVRHVVVLPDIHLGRMVNNGCVAATVDLVYPEAVGGDIGCGFSALAFEGQAALLADERNAQAVLRHLYERVPALKHRGGPSLPAKLANAGLSDEALTRASRRDGACQLGTLGRGNHFVEFQQDDTGVLWLMVHSGSRGMGQNIFGFHLERAAKSGTGLRYLDGRTDAGRAYLADMQWAVQYATMNRLSILARASEFLEALFQVEANEDSYLDCPHNFARWEDHAGTRYLVHRKSANSAGTDERGLVAGSAGTPSFIVRGRGEQDALCSSSHGAGRVMSRTEARQRIAASDVRLQLGSVYCDPAILSELRDEAPRAYRDIREVLRAQRDLIRQELRLSPVLSFKYTARA